jgi:hypothetical protein
MTPDELETAIANGLRRAATVQGRQSAVVKLVTWGIVGAVAWMVVTPYPFPLSRGRK